MKKLALTLVIFCALSAFTYAGPESIPSGKEMIQPTAVTTACFDGWYFGIHGGGILGGDNDVFTETIVTNPGRSFIDSDSDSGENEWGGQGGLHMGRNFQRGGWVFGAEVDLSASNFEADGGPIFASISAPRDISSLTASETTLNWYSTVRARIGHTLGQRVFAFVTGGLAVGSSDLTINSDLDINLREGTEPFGFRLTDRGDSDIEVGWTGGGGFDFCLSEHFILNFTYLYVDLGDRDVSTSFGTISPNGNFTVNATNFAQSEIKFHVFQAGVSFKF